MSTVYDYLSKTQLVHPLDFDFTDDGDMHNLDYQRVVSSFVNSYGLNNYELELADVQDTLLQSQDFVKFLNAYKHLLSISNSNTWDALKTKIGNTIQSHLTQVSNKRDNFDNNALKVSSADSNKDVAIINTSDETVLAVYIEDDDTLSANDPSTVISKIEPGELKRVNVSNLDEMHALCFNIVGNNEKIVLNPNLPQYISDINILDGYMETYEESFFALTSNIPLSSDANVVWKLDGVEIASVDVGDSVGYNFTDAGTYTLSVSVEENGEVILGNTKMVMVHENDSIIPTKPRVTVSSDAYTEGQNITMSATSTSADSTSSISYAWSLTPTGSAFATTDTVEVTPNGEESTVYFVKATNEHGTSDITSIVLFNDDYVAPPSGGTRVLEPYQNSNNQWINSYYLDGLENHNLFINSVTVTLQSTLVINGDLNVSGNLDLNGKTLTINGNLYHKNGALNIHGGTLIVNGDLIIDKEGTDAYSTGMLVMTNSTDYVLVHGDFVMNSSYSHNGYLTVGTLEVKGNFTQKYANRNGYDNFYTSGTHKTILSGESKQTVNFQTPNSSYSHFNILEITNTSSEGVDFLPSLAANHLVNSTIDFNDLVIYSMNYTLEQDSTVEGDLNLTGATLDLNGTTLTINGNLYQTGGTLKVNNGTLIVKGDYIIDNGDSYSYGKLLMTNESDYVKVEGNFVMNSSYSHNGYLTAGTLEVKGNFTQKYANGNGYDNFYTSGTHKTILSGESKQTVNFQTPGSSYSHFNILEIRNTSEEGIVFATSAYVLGNLTATTCVSPLDLTNVTVNGITNLSESCIPDEIAPIITLLGSNPQHIELGNSYVELNATTDDGSPIDINATAVNTNVVGEYSVSYNAIDASSNQAIEVTRTVIVEDTIAPVITLTGANPQTLERATVYVELNATTDDGSLITIDSSAVDMNTAGEYNVTYNATDASSNQAIEVTRTVIVEDTIAPVITLTGANPQTLERATAYVELNATTDDGSLITIDSSAVDMNTAGEYNVTYNATDASSNQAIEVTRTVIVEDSNDIDNDGIPDSEDDDNDNDGVVDSLDDFPLNPNESVDTDHDGIGNNADKDDDNDGISDADEIKWGLDPLDDSDGGNADADGDGVSNADEIEAGSDPLDSDDTKKPKKFVPIMMDGLIIMIPIADN